MCSFTSLGLLDEHGGHGADMDLAGVWRVASYLVPGKRVSPSTLTSVVGESVVGNSNPDTEKL